MNKKVIAILLSCVMLVSASPVVAAEETTVRPTVEEILNEYHQKAFEAESAAATDKATTYSNRSGSGSKTLEQETVDTLNAAGYEAYNVTASNYDALEASLKTDFASMGLNLDSSYIVVISGEDSDNSNYSRAIGDDLITPTPEPGEDTDPNFFMYTYNGHTYNMRYVTITSNENHEYRASDLAKLPISYTSQFGINFLQTVFYLCLDYATEPVPTSAVFSLLGLNTSDGYSVNKEPIAFHGTAIWTRVFIQIWDFDLGWCTVQSSAYVTTKSYCSGYIYDASISDYVKHEGEEEICTIYSPKYHNKTQCKTDAVITYLEYYPYIEHDETGDVRFYHQNMKLFTLYEQFGMEPIFPEN